MSINNLETLSKEELIEKLKEAGILEAYIWGCGCCESPHIYFKGNDIGTYRSAVEAAKAYDEYAIKLHGVFAITNKSLGLLNDIV